MGSDSSKALGTSEASEGASAEENIRNQLERSLGQDLEALPLERKAQLVREVTTMVSMSGPLPPPAIAREYEEICPGFVDRSFRMAEKAQDASIEAVRDERDKNQFYRLFGMACAAILSGLLVIGGLLIAYFVNPWAGVVTALVSFIGSVVVAFIDGRPLRDHFPQGGSTKDGKVAADSSAARKPRPAPKKKRR